MTQPKEIDLSEIHLGGRPRLHDREEIALDMIQWAKKDDSINLCGYCAENELAPTLLINWSNEKTLEGKRFRLAYDLVKSMIGKRREELLTNNKLHVKAYDLNAKTYDKFLKEERMEEIETEIRLKVASQVSPNESNLNNEPQLIAALQEIELLKKKLKEHESKS